MSDREKKTLSGTIMDRNAPGPMTSMLEEKARICSRSGYVMGCCRTTIPQH
jgi:hypothetical protein